ncbi:MAG: FGGY-family carbohydrate kinase [Anaerolineae bacterium]|nr:FGGY-family carbohydrate kinase [Anaerolineae bacterium]
MPYLLGLDVGTTNTKAVLYDLEGRMRALASTPTPLTEAGPGEATRDPEQLYRAAVGVIRQAAAQVERAEVLALSVSSMGEAGVPLDRRGQPVYPIIAWYDRRTLPYRQWWQSHFGDDRLFAICGLQPGHIFSLNKIMWLRDHEPTAYRRLALWLSVSDYVAYRLCGVPSMSYPQACRTMAFDLHTLDWSPELLAAAEVPRDLFPRLVPSAEPLGALRPEAAEACGLPRSTIVAAGGHDHICAAVAAAVTQPGALLDSIGTTEAAMAVLEQPRTEPAVRALGLSCGAHAAPGRYYLIGGLLGIGPLLTWLVETLLELPPGEEGYAALTEAAKASPPGARGLYLLPFLAGAGSPEQDPRATGALLGLRLHHSRADLARAALEGVCYELRRLLESLHALTPGGEDVLRAVGGGARNPFWLQLRADVTGHTVEVPEGTERAALGAALLGGVAAGVYRSVEEAATNAYRLAQVYRPDARAHQEYSARYEETYRRLHQAALLVTAE